MSAKTIESVKYQESMSSSNDGPSLKSIKSNSSLSFYGPVYSDAHSKESSDDDLEKNFVQK